MTKCVKSGILMTLLVSILLVSCGPSQAELDSYATSTAASRFMTQTAAVPTWTASPEPTSTATLTPTYRPPGPWLITPQAEVQGELRVETYVDEEKWDVILRISREDQVVQEVVLNDMRFDNRTEDYFYPIGISNINAIYFSDFEKDGDPEITLGIETPGTSCCTLVFVLYFDKSSGKYLNSDVLVNKWTLSPVLADVNQDGVEEIIRHNEDFYNSMGGVGSGAAISPIQVITFSDGELIDASDQFPEIIEEDAERLLDIIVDYDDCSGTLWSCYMVQMSVLGRLDEGWEFFEDFCSHWGDQYYEIAEGVRVNLELSGYIR